MKFIAYRPHLAAILAFVLTSCSTYTSLDELERHADDHASSSNGYGYNVYIDRPPSTFEVALDARSAATAALGWIPPEADADYIKTLGHHEPPTM
jgi:hypothetical protein